MIQLLAVGIHHLRCGVICREALHLLRLAAIESSLDRPLLIGCPNICHQLTRKLRILLTKVDGHLVLGRIVGRFVVPIHLVAIDLKDAITTRRTVGAEHSLPPRTTQRGDHVLVQTISNLLIISSMSMSRQNMCIVGRKHTMQLRSIGHHICDRTITELLTILLLAGRGYMQNHKHGRALIDIAEVLFEPSELTLIEIADIEVITTDIEIVVQHHIVRLAHIERVAHRTEGLLPKAGRGLVRTAIQRHIVVAGGAEKVQTRRCSHLIISGIERMIVRNHIATADAVERNIVALDRASNVGHTLAERRELLFMPDLRIGNHHKTVVRVVLRLAHKRKVVAPLVRLLLLPELRNTLLRRYVVTRRNSDINQSVIVCRHKFETTLRVGLRKVLAIGYDHRGNSLAIALDRTFEGFDTRSPRHCAPHECDREQQYTFHRPPSYFSIFCFNSLSRHSHLYRPRGTWKHPFHLPPLSVSSTSPRRFR